MVVVNASILTTVDGRADFRRVQGIDANGQSLAYVYSRDTDSDALIANVLTTDEAMGQMKSGVNSTDQGGTGIKASAEGDGGTNKSTEDPTAPTGSQTGASTGNAPGGTGVEQSTEGQGSTNKN